MNCFDCEYEPIWEKRKNYMSKTVKGKVVYEYEDAGECRCWTEGLPAMFFCCQEIIYKKWVDIDKNFSECPAWQPKESEVNNVEVDQTVKINLPHGRRGRFVFPL